MGFLHCRDPCRGQAEAIVIVERDSRRGSNLDARCGGFGRIVRYLAETRQHHEDNHQARISHVPLLPQFGLKCGNNAANGQLAPLVWQSGSVDASWLWSGMAGSAEQPIAPYRDRSVHSGHGSGCIGKGACRDTPFRQFCNA